MNVNILDSELIPPQYAVYRNDKEETVQNQGGGGILMAFKKDIISRRFADLEPDCKIMWFANQQLKQQLLFFFTVFLDRHE